MTACTVPDCNQPAAAGSPVCSMHGLQQFHVKAGNYPFNENNTQSMHATVARLCDAVAMLRSRASELEARILAIEPQREPRRGPQFGG